MILLFEINLVMGIMFKQIFKVWNNDFNQRKPRKKFTNRRGRECRRPIASEALPRPPPGPVFL